MKNPAKNTALIILRKPVKALLGNLAIRNWPRPLANIGYADRHKGVCLGFDVRGDAVKKVEYVEKRTLLRPPLTEDSIQLILFTKYAGWSYEQEWRVWFALEESDPEASNQYFREFDDEIRLREVIAGPLCTVSKSALTKAIRNDAPPPRLIKARLAFDSFEVVRNKRGFER